MKWDMDGAEFQFSWSGWRWAPTWMEVKCDSRDLDGGEIGYRWRWDANLGTWVGMRRSLDGGESWIFRPGRGWHGLNLKHISWDYSGGRMGSGWRLDTNLGNWMELRCDLVNCWYQACRRHRVWMEVRCKTQDLHGGEMRHRLKQVLTIRIWMEVKVSLHRGEMKFWDLDWGEMWPGWRSDTHLESGWQWGGAWVELRCNFCDLNAAETWPWWRWDANIGNWMEMWCISRDLNWVSWDLDEAHILRPRWMELGCNSGDLDVDETRPGWRRNTNIPIWKKVRHIYRTWLGVRWDLDKAKIQKTSLTDTGALRRLVANQREVMTRLLELLYVLNIKHNIF